MTVKNLDPFLDYLVAGDRQAATRFAIDLVDRGLPVSTVITDVVCAAQIEVGRLWQINEWSVAQEHAATAVSEHVVASLFGHPSAPTRVTPAKGHLIAVCVEGEWHTMAIRVLAGFVEQAGWDVTFLGPSVPRGHLQRYLHDIGPDGLLISCSLPTNLLGARRIIEVSRETGTPVLAGGRAFGSNAKRAKTLGADAWAPTAADAVERLEDWKRFTKPVAALTHPGYFEHSRMERRIEELTDNAMRLVLERFTPAAKYDQDQLDRTREDLRYLLDFVSTALLVDDPTIFEEYVEWHAVVLEARGLPAKVTMLGLEASADVTAHDFPIAHTMLRRTALGLAR